MSRLEYTYRRIRREHSWLLTAAEIAITCLALFAICLLLADGLIMVN